MPTSSTFDHSNHSPTEIPPWSDPFGESEALNDFDPSHPLIPTRQENYVFRPELLDDVLSYLREPNGEGLFLTGPRGSGKTSLITQIAARLNWPVQSVTCYQGFALSALLGPLSDAAREGHLLLIEEFDRMDPSAITVLHGILDGQPVFTEHGELIRPHPRFRIIATGGLQSSEQDRCEQTCAALDRFLIISVEYPKPAVERQVLQAVVPSLSAEIISKMVAVASEMRLLFARGNLSVTMSLHSLIRWARLVASSQSVSLALEQALTARVEPPEREVIYCLVADLFAVSPDSVVSVSPRSQWIPNVKAYDGDHVRRQVRHIRDRLTRG